MAREKSNIPLKHASVLRGPSQVAFDITNKCNLRCLHCFNTSGENKILTQELTDREVISFIEDLAGLRPLNVCFCGGETLLREDLICRCMPILRDAGSLVSMVTNGVLVTREKAVKLVDSGLCNVQVSVDGARPETHEKLRLTKGSFAGAINAVKIFSEFDVTLGIAFAPTRFNIDEVPELFRMLKEFGIDELRFQPLMALGRAQKNIAELLPTPLQYRQLVRSINDLKRTDSSIKLEWGDPVDHLIRFRRICEYCVNHLDVRADGKIIVSPYIPLVVGDIRKHKFSEYWDAGLARVWEIPVVKELASGVNSTYDFGNQTVFTGEDTEIDIIDQCLLEEIKGGETWT